MHSRAFRLPGQRPAGSGRVPHVCRVLGATVGGSCVVRRTDDVPIVRTPCTNPFAPPPVFSPTGVQPSRVGMLGDVTCLCECRKVIRRSRSHLPSSLADDLNLCERVWAWAGGTCARACVSSCACRTGLASALSPNSCIHYCSILGYAYAGLQADACQCGDAYGAEGPSTGCDTTCPGDLRQICGGEEAVSVWQVGTPLAKTRAFLPLPPSPTHLATSLPSLKPKGSRAD